tara:strand:+ start:1030 stop:1719 length:690 start_codon:yes stop_codon:yes gene_type:complete
MEANRTSAGDGPAPRGDATRDALLATAIDVFGQVGFHAASTRAIARQASVNQALIAYHFRNKEGLYLAAFAHMAARIKERIGPVAEAVRADLALDDAAGRDRHLASLCRMTDALAALLAGEESAPWARLIIREQQSPGPAFDVIFDGVMRPVSQVMIDLVSRLDPDGRAGDPRLVVATVIGQILMFRMARAAAMRVMGWTAVGATEISQIQGQVRQNLSALFPTSGERS